ncbi:MaoC family dehydratase [Roseibium alexandrii]|jgi:acyl dehydratase|uniref:MaoC family dehydratase n=1 Tax=Roseibium alexandrii TaxID=388408 RepID=UPI003751DEEF
MPDIYHFEDFEPGQVFELGSVTATKDQIIEFAEEFDPQPFHLDEEAGKASMLGGLAASGWHTGSMVMRLLAINLLNKSTGQGSPGIDELKWQSPVYPGDTLTAKAEVLASKELRSKPDLGIVTFRITATNQNQKQVMFWENPILFLKREAAP